MSKELERLVRAGYSAVVLNTAEEDRALVACQEISKTLNKEFAFWSLTKGEQTKVKNYDSMTPQVLQNEIKSELDCKKDLQTDSIKVLEEPLKTKCSNGMVYALLDFHPFIKSPNVWRRAKDLFKIAKSRGITYIFISSDFEVPGELRREVIITSLPLPTREELSDAFKNMAKTFNIPVPNDYMVYVEATLGLTINEAENAFATSLARYGRFDVGLINKVKEKTICNNGLIECMTCSETMDSIGGMKNFTNWAKQRLLAFSPEAKNFGIPAPKGTLLIGIPGGGKSLSAKALANLWQKPLLRVDIGKLFGSLVGQTEANTREMLKMAEAMAPCILWIDEIEKGLSGIQSSGRTDGGVTSRAFGTILTWLQEKDCPVFVIATANNISELPPEFLRKGRFDEIFFVDIPSEKEREEIFSIQLKKYKRNPDEFDVKTFAKMSEKFTGAEIEQVIINALYDSWNSESKTLGNQEIMNAISNINPMAESGSMSRQIEAIRQWAKDAHIKMANNNESSVDKVNTGRGVITKEGESKSEES